ncbi:MAG: hypothetical protein FWE06_07635 [Oscillospiraceae bacterium]|nr:hypothetical protein [Oscillospiraceae bacterium]
MLPFISYVRPAAPAPNIAPSYPGTMDVRDHLPNALHTCVYLWTKSNGRFWMFPTAILPGDVLVGYQWDRGFWRNFSLSLADIDAFH